MKFKYFFIVGIFFLIPLFVSAKDYDFYVDDSAKSGGDGSVGKPFKDIESAIKKADKKGGSQEIYIYKGDYSGGFTVSKAISLIGEDEDRVVISGTIVMADNSEIKKVTIKGGSTSVSVNKNAEVEIENCVIRDFGKIGVDIPEGNGKLTIQNSKIKNGDGKGVYVQRGNRIKFIENEIYDNDEEGLDLRSKISGVIIGNYIYNNKEGGIEVIVGDADLEISNNTIKGNKASAIAAQFYQDLSDMGDIDVKNNKLTGNGNYALDCKNTQGGMIQVDYWRTSIKLSGNVFADNNSGSVNKICKMKILDLAKISSDKNKDDADNDDEEILTEEIVTDDEQLSAEDELMKEVEERRERRQADVKIILEKNTENIEVAKVELEKIRKEGRIKIFFFGVDEQKIDMAKNQLEKQSVELQKAVELLGGDYSKMSEGEELKIKVNEELSWNAMKKNYLMARGNSFSLLGWIKKIFHI